MKYYLLTFLLFILLLNDLNAQQKNEYSFGYGLTISQIHYAFGQYSRKIGESKLYWGLRGEFYTFELKYNQPYDEISNFSIFPNKNFIYEGNLNHDRIDLGIKQLDNYDGYDMMLLFNSLIRYNYDISDRFFTSAQLSLGIVLIKSQGLLDGIIARSTAFNKDAIGALLFESYFRAIDFSGIGIIRGGFNINEKICIGLEGRIENQIKVGGFTVLGDVFLGFKF